MRPDWMNFVRLSLPEGVDGGGGTEPGSSGVGEGAGAGEVVAGEESPAPAATFLTEKRGEETTPAEGEAKPEGETAAEVEAPAAFDPAALTLPEGFTLDEENSKAFAELLSDDKLPPQERGQKLVELHTAALKQSVEAAIEQSKLAAAESYKKMNDDWRAQIKELPEFKANPDAEAGKVMQALISVGADEKFFQALDLTGAGNNPAILQVLHRLTKPYFEGGAVGNQGKAPSAKRLGDNIFTSANKS